MDEQVFQSVNRFARGTPWLHGLVLGYATYGVIVFAALLVVGWWVARRSGRVDRIAAAVCAGAGTLLAVAVNQPVVDHIHEPRPYTTHAHILVLAQRSADFSYPSDHAVMAGAAALGLFFVHRWLGLAAAAAAVAMAFSRVYIAAHYPSDVVAGLMLGVVIGLAGYATTAPILTRALDAAGRTRLRPLLLTPPTGTQGS
jgi:undecaprenyl-diphosphatase